MSREGLLRAIADTPEDDTVRLVFADWLDECGDEADRAHAELIRVQIALANLPLDDDRRAELDARDEGLRYHGDVRKRLEIPPCIYAWPFSHGFPERAGFDWNDRRKGRLSEEDLAQIAEAMRRLPICTFAGDLLGCATSDTSVNLPPAGQSGLELLAAWPGLARFTALETSSGITPYEDRGHFAPGLLALAESPHARGLRRLRLGAWQIDPDALAVLAASLPHLTELDLGLHHMDATVEALQMLLVTPLSGRLERLLCDWVDVPAETIRAWLDQAPLSCLAFGPSDDEGVGPLLGSPGLSRLRELRITGEDHGFDVDEMPGDEDHRVVPYLTNLLASGSLTGLETLSARGVALGDDGVRALVAGSSARSLVELDLSLSGLTGAGLRELRTLLSHGRLRRLAVDHNELTTADAEEMASWPEFGRLHRLDVGFFNYMENEGRKALETSPHRHPFLKVS